MKPFFIQQLSEMEFAGHAELLLTGDWGESEVAFRKLIALVDCIVKFRGDFRTTIAGLFVDGTLNAVGTANSPIVFTSYRDDAPDAGATPTVTDRRPALPRATWSISSSAV